MRIDETRRDPFEFVALRTSDLKAASSYYEALGMTRVAEEQSKRDKVMMEKPHLPWFVRQRIEARERQRGKSPAPASKGAKGKGTGKQRKGSGKKGGGKKKGNQKAQRSKN